MKSRISIISFIFNILNIKKANGFLDYNFRYVGSTKPLVNFDPLKILDNKSENKVKFVREAELQHGRLAMLASLFIPSVEILDKKTLGIDYLSSMNLENQLPFWSVVSLLEVSRMVNGWENPFTSNDTFQLKQNYQPGNLLNIDMKKISDDYMNIELNNGRLAMIAVLGEIVQELTTHKGLF
tara:strand:+ start:678 stop:1223 length:546 start_codon:yes stop_codon:yes gene_type:complete